MQWPSWLVPPRRLLALSVLLMLAPALALVWLGWRLMEQDRFVAPRIETSIQLAPEKAGRVTQTELDIRGMRLHEAMERLDEYLDDSLSHGLTNVRIIHGKGTGTLRQGVWHHLANHSAVDEFDFAPRERGGDGATEVVLA